MTKLPSGGPFAVSQKVSETILAHLELECSFERTGARRAALKQRDALVNGLAKHDKDMLAAIGAALERLGSTTTKKKAA
jgi:hypothetical protein